MVDYPRWKEKIVFLFYCAHLDVAYAPNHTTKILDILLYQVLILTWCFKTFKLLNSQFPHALFYTL